MATYKLTMEIIKLSNSSIWEEAKLEWRLDEVYEDHERQTCLCGHFPIIEICVLKNSHNKNFVTVGNSCVKKFIGLPSNKIFQSVKRVRKDNTKALNEKSLQHAYDKGWINNWELEFGKDTMRKRNLSDKQLQTRIKINKKMIENMKRKRT